MRDCEDFTGNDRKDGIKPIMIGGVSVDVYCEYGDNGVGSLTTFQRYYISTIIIKENDNFQPW